MEDTDEKARKPSMKYNDAILPFNTCIDWATENIYSQSPAAVTDVKENCQKDV